MNRLLKLRKALGLTQKEFSSRLGVYQSEISRVENDDEAQELTPRLKFLIRQAFPSVSLEWLESGAGEMFRDNQEVSPASSPLSFALSQGFGQATAAAFDRLCHMTQAQKDAIERLLIDDKAREITTVIYGK